jgi:hypothetical protein
VNETVKTTATPRWLRFLAILLAILLLLWLPFEDVTETWVITFSAAVCAWAAVRFLILTAHTPGNPWIRHIYTGLLAGLFITPLALFLMALKTGLHGHETADFSARQMARVVELTPIWMSVGLLFGLGSCLWRFARSK